MLTAAHCVASAENQDGTLRTPHLPDGSISINGIKPIDIDYYGDFFPDIQEFHDDDQAFSRDEAQDENYAHDLVLAIFPDGTGDRLGFARDGYPSLAKTQIKENEGVIFVGFGMLDITNHNSAGIRRTGTNVLSGMFEDLYYVTGLAMPDRTIIGAVLQMTRQNKVQIGGVYQNSLAYKAGIRPGDIVVSINGTTVRTGQDLIDGLQAAEGNAAITVMAAADGRQTVRNIPVGPKIKLGEQADVLPGDSGGPLLNANQDIAGVASHIHLYRTGNQLTGAFVDALSKDNLTLYKQSVAGAKTKANARGISASSRVPSKYDLGATYEPTADNRGVKLATVTAGGPLANAGLKAGSDTLLEVNGVHLKNAEDVTFGLDMPDSHTHHRESAYGGWPGRRAERYADQNHQAGGSSVTKETSPASSCHPVFFQATLVELIFRIPSEYFIDRTRRWPLAKVRPRPAPDPLRNRSWRTDPDRR